MQQMNIGFSLILMITPNIIIHNSGSRIQISASVKLKDEYRKTTSSEPQL